MGSTVKDGADSNFMKPRSLNSVGNILRNQLVLSDEYFTGFGMNNLECRVTACKTVRKRLDNILLIVGNYRKFSNIREILCSAVFFQNNYILSNINQTAWQVTGVSRLKCGIGKCFSGSMRRDKEFKHVHTFTQVGLDRNLNSFTGCISHVAAHTGELFDLVDISTCTGIGHHLDRVVFTEVLLEFFSNRIGGIRPNGNNCLVTALFIQHTALVHAVDVFNLVLSFMNHALFNFRNDHIFDTNGYTAAGSIFVSKSFNIIK